MTRYMPITGIDCTIPSLLIAFAASLNYWKRFPWAKRLVVMLRCCKSLRGCWHSRCAMAAICWMWSGGGCGRSFKFPNKNGRLQGRPFLCPKLLNIAAQAYARSTSQEFVKNCL